MTAAHQLHVYPNAESLAHGACQAVVDELAACLRERPQASIALAGGSTPRRLYELLSAPAVAARIDWRRVHFFWGDERCVAPDHADSNYAMARRALLDELDLPAANVHRMAGELDPATAAAAYAADLTTFFATTPPAFPRFDLILLGLGTDGHTASLFPGSTARHERHRWVAPITAAPNRLTLTFPVINNARAVYFVVSGRSKAETLAEVLARSAGHPAEKVQPRGELHFFVDRPAASASRLTAGGRSQEPDP